MNSRTAFSLACLRRGPWEHEEPSPLQRRIPPALFAELQASARRGLQAERDGKGVTVPLSTIRRLANPGDAPPLHQVAEIGAPRPEREKPATPRPHRLVFSTTWGQDDDGEGDS